LKKVFYADSKLSNKLNSAGFMQPTAGKMQNVNLPNSLD